MNCTKKIARVLFCGIYVLTCNPLAAQEAGSDTTQLKEIVVTGTRVGLARNNVAMSVSLINEKTIENSGQANILPIIQECIPGVFVTERGVMGFGVAQNSAGKIKIRGIGGDPNNQVLILIDGHPQFAGIFGHPLPDAYVSSDAERVEVIRGPASVLYGSNAMGGVINIITKQQKEEGLHGNANISYGLFNTQEYMGRLGYKRNKWSAMVSFNHQHTNGHRDTSAFTNDNGYAKINYDISEHFKISGNLSIAKFNADDPGPESMVGKIPQAYNIDIIRSGGAVSFENKYNKMEGMLTAFQNYGEHKLSDGFHSEDFNTGIMFYEGFKLFKNNTITAGIDYKKYGGEAENIKANKGQGAKLGNEAIEESAGYLFVQHILLSKISVNAGFRLENNSRFGNEYIPQFGISYNHNPSLTVKSSASKGFRSPTIRELYFFPPSCNPELKPEEVWSYEIGMIKTLLKNKLKLEITGFIAEGSNLIQQSPPPKYINTGTFNNKGIELSGQYSMNTHIKTYINYSWLSIDKPILAAPEHHLFMGADYQYKKATLSVHIKYVNNLYTRLENSKTAQSAIRDSYTLLGARISYEITKNCKVFINGKNLTDTPYEVNYDYPMPGIAVSGGINIGF